MNRENDWRFLLEVSKAADKYLLPELDVQAFAICRDATRALSDATEALSVMDIIRSSDYTKFFRLADALEKRLRGALLKTPEYRSRIELDKNTMWDIIDQFNHADDAMEMLVLKCRKCSHISIRERSLQTCPAQRCNDIMMFIGKCWISKGIADQT